MKKIRLYPNCSEWSERLNLKIIGVTELDVQKIKDLLKENNYEYEVEEE